MGCASSQGGAAEPKGAGEGRGREQPPPHLELPLSPRLLPKAGGGLNESETGPLFEGHHDHVDSSNNRLSKLGQRSEIEGEEEEVASTKACSEDVPSSAKAFLDGQKISGDKSNNIGHQVVCSLRKQGKGLAASEDDEEAASTVAACSEVPSSATALTLSGLSSGRSSQLSTSQTSVASASGPQTTAWLVGTTAHHGNARPAGQGVRDPEALSEDEVSSSYPGRLSSRGLQGLSSGSSRSRGIPLTQDQDSILYRGNGAKTRPTKTWPGASRGAEKGGEVMFYVTSHRR